VIVYIAGPYTAPTAGQVDANIGLARDAAAEVYRHGHIPLCPHALTARFERDYPDIPGPRYLESDLELLARCDAILMLPRWEESRGAQQERERAMSLGLPVYYSVEELPKP